MREKRDSEGGGRTERGGGPTPAAALLSPVTPGGGRARAHACEHTGLAAEPPCQCKHASAGMEMSWLLSPLAAQDLQAFEMQD